MKKQRIAIFTNGWSSEYISNIVEGIRKKAGLDGVDLFIYTSYILWGESGARRSTKLNLYSLPDPSDYDGVIILANTYSASDEPDAILKLFRNSNVPVISTEVRLPGVAYLGTDNYKGMQELSDHLIDEHDVRDVIFFKGITDNEESNIRQKALEDTLKKHGLKLCGVLQGNFEFFQTTLCMDEWFEKGEKLPDAFVCANDLMALGVIYKLYERGYSVPDDVIVTGFDHIREGQTTYPMIATVSRQWNKMGENVYDVLKQLMDKWDPDYGIVYDSRFIPSESCGCTPEPESLKYRLDTIRNQYRDATVGDMVEFQFQEIRVSMSRIESLKAFHDNASEVIELKDYLGGNYCICTQHQFFEKNDDEYEPETSYDENMLVLFERESGEPLPQREFPVSEVYPGYRHEEGRSNIYVITPLSNLDHNIGYLAVKNKPEVLYDLCFKKLINNINTLLENVRQYSFSQENNRKLKNIYMTDFLTGMYNRTGCEDVLFKFLESEKKDGRNAMLIFTDIDCMKTINDVYGHVNGDMAIKATAEAIRKSLPEGWIMGRFGGDEFVAVGPHDGSVTIEKYRERFRSALKEISEREHLTFRLSASAGDYTVTPDSDGGIEDYIRMADVSMYEEKEKAHREMGVTHG